ncbi:MAG: hypothetical protein EPO47_00555 [Rugosibacter sp.]|nr:MAG: hypothetical protein EPO60_11055 [Rugosibacter sp.]TBR12060.1 MAG: hypothetical protein EPO47_00555 [Rugosibacter sp.]
MNKDSQKPEPVDNSTDLSVDKPTALDLSIPSRRRLIKLGAVAVPIVATLASRPALAWHCKSPSAWGSEIINPNTSLRTNEGHQSYPDETWYISNWANNTARGSVGYSALPWNKFFDKYSDIKNAVNSNWKKVKISHLTSKGINCGTASQTAYACNVLTSGTSLQKATITAQLNYLILSPLTRNEMEQCLGFPDLQRMASGSYSPSGTGVTWTSDAIVKYLKDNWIAL